MWAFFHKHLEGPLREPLSYISLKTFKLVLALKWRGCFLEQLWARKWFDFAGGVDLVFRYSVTNSFKGSGSLIQKQRERIKCSFCDNGHRETVKIPVKPKNLVRIFNKYNFMAVTLY